MELSPLLPAVDDYLYRARMTKCLNEALGSALGPFDWDDWPLETLDVILGWAYPESD